MKDPTLAIEIVRAVKKSFAGSTHSQNALWI